jgi:hypothetical protein
MRECVGKRMRGRMDEWMKRVKKKGKMRLGRRVSSLGIILMKDCK